MECQCNATDYLHGVNDDNSNQLINNVTSCFDLEPNICYRLGWYTTNTLNEAGLNSTSCAQWGDGYSLPTNDTYYLLFNKYYNCLTTQDLDRINTTLTTGIFGTFKPHGIAIDWPNGCGCDWNDESNCTTLSIDAHNGRKWYAYLHSLF